MLKKLNLKSTKSWLMATLLGVSSMAYAITPEEQLSREINARYAIEKRDIIAQANADVDKILNQYSAEISRTGAFYSPAEANRRIEESNEKYSKIWNKFYGKVCQFLLPYAKQGNLYAQYVIAYRCSSQLRELRPLKFKDILTSIIDSKSEFTSRITSDNDKFIVYRGSLRVNAFQLLGEAYLLGWGGAVAKDLEKAKFYYKMLCEEEGYCYSYNSTVDRENKCNRGDMDACELIGK